jgi:hypothetical protein
MSSTQARHSTELYLVVLAANILDSDKVNKSLKCWQPSSSSIPFAFQYPSSALLGGSKLHTSTLLQKDSCKMAEENALKWLVSSGGWYDETAMGLQEYPGMGLGAVALRDIEVRPSSLTSRSYLTL